MNSQAAPSVSQRPRGGTDPAISIRNVTVRFGKVVAAQDVSVDIRQGEFVSIVGPSGCGKTTVLNLLTGLLP
ncbi:MAG TPA: ATP-binding cassette domain-containing protein, partial [Aliiroseovarius sp.]|nr:ATP-binding cassette domain-containing protein [Aliiroseovarius sp.]